LKIYFYNFCNWILTSERDHYMCYMRVSVDNFRGK
jgi:hypothetical protein